MRIWFEIDRLTSLNLTPQDLIAAIQARTSRRRSAASAPSRSPTPSNSRSTSRRWAAWSTLEQFGNIVFRANPDGSLLRIRDVARVELGAQSQDPSPGSTASRR